MSAACYEVTAMDQDTEVEASYSWNLRKSVFSPAQARKRHHHRRVIASPLQHGEGAADLRAARHGGVHQIPGGARNRALQPRASLLLRQGQRLSASEWTNKHTSVVSSHPAQRDSSALVRARVLGRVSGGECVSAEHSAPTHSNTHSSSQMHKRLF